jgi:hypothetical protein
MTAAPSLAFPGGRTLAGWWRQLSSLRPEAFWVGHLFLHRIEALTRLRRHHRPDPFALLVLRALALEPPAGRPQPPANNHHTATPGEEQLQRLDGRLHLGRQALGQVLRGLAGQGLAEGEPQAGWRLAASGHQALAEGIVAEEVCGRQTFCFVERSPEGGPGRSPPAFLALRAGGGRPWPVGTEWPFDAAVLRACVAQTDEWKQRHGFPTEVAEVLGPEAPSGREQAAAETWQRVLLDRPEHLVVAVLREAEGADRRLLGFAVRPEGWALQTSEPVFILPADGAEALPELRVPPEKSAWERAWRQWCEQRGFPAGEAGACRLEVQGVRLRVASPARLLERLRAARSDALKGEAWLLAGEGRIRAAARVEVAEPSP